ncbi:unnamed protein product [Calypogeia fissa]
MEDQEVAQEEQQSSYYYWPSLSFDVFPRCQYHFHHQFRDCSTKSGQEGNNFLKGLKWSSDGSCFLTSSDDNILQRFDLPSDAAEDVSEVDFTTSPEDSFRSSLTFQEGESVYDYCWYPNMNASDPGSCVFATTSRDHPVHLWDAMTGELRCTYRAFDAMDEITAAYSMCFNPAGTKLYCGYKKLLRVFDTSRPGREFSQHSTLTDAKDGQAGIISCLAFNPSNEGLLAAGSYNRTTALYSEDTLEMLFVLHGQQGGVTQVMFSKDGNFLYTGARKDPDILCWDVRNTVSTVYKLQRVTADTNQRITFDIAPNGGHLATGGQDGLVHIYDLQTGAWVNSFQAALDTVNSFGFHPSLPLAASASGHRRFKSSADDENDDESHQTSLKVEENCASVWRFACSWVSESSSHEEKFPSSMEQDIEDNSSTPNQEETPTDLYQPQ